MLASTRITRSKVAKASSVTIKKVKLKKLEATVRAKNTTRKVKPKSPQVQIPENIELKQEFIEKYLPNFIEGLNYVLKLDATLYQVATSNDYPTFHKSKVELFNSLIDSYQQNNDLKPLMQYFFKFLSQSIISQQLSGKSANAIKARVINKFKESNAGLEYPDPDFFLGLSVEDLSKLGLGIRKAQYLKSLSEFFVDDSSSKCELFLNSSVEDISEQLIKIKGLGPWTINMFLLFGLKKLDIFDSGDLGIARGTSIYFQERQSVFKELMSQTEITSDDKCRWTKSKSKKKWDPIHEKYISENARKFKPYRLILMLILWHISNTFVESLK